MLRFSSRMTLIEELSALVRALDDAHVEYALVGGLAVAVWGVPRATKDIDLLVERADAERAAAVAKGCGFTLDALPMEFEDGMEMRRLNKIDGDGTLLTVDFLLVGAAQRSVWEGRQRVPFQTGSISVASREGLIAMKLAAGRAQDLADVQKLRETDR
jgi:hypothetical protein